MVTREHRRPGLEVPYGEIQSLSVSDFVHKDLVNFSLADIRRSIASVVDGFKPSQRKVMHACFQRNLTGEMKVAQLAAYVSEKRAITTVRYRSRTRSYDWRTISSVRTMSRCSYRADSLEPG